MTFGDTVITVATVADDAYLTIQPGEGIAWVIHNIYAHPSVAIEIYFCDGTTDTLFDTNTGPYLGYQFHPNNTYYFKVKNVSGASAKIGYDGIVAQETA